MLEKTLESLLDCKEIKPVNPKGNQSWIFIGRTDTEDEAPIIWPPDSKSWLIRKDPDTGKDWGHEGKGTTENEMVEWHHWPDGRECEQAPGVGSGQGRLVCYSPWGRKESDMTEWLNWCMHTCCHFSYVWLFAVPWIAAWRASLSLTISQFAQTHVDWVSDAIEPSLFLLPAFLPAFNLSQREDLFQWVGSSCGQSNWASASALVLPMNIQGWFPLGLTGLLSLQSKRLSRVCSSTTIWKNQFFSAQPSLWPNSHIHIWLLEKT